MCACTLLCFACAGVKANGAPKLRAIDDLSRSGVNACTLATEKLRNDTLDYFWETLRGLNISVQALLIVCLCAFPPLCSCFCLQEDVVMWTADIDSAFRRLPILAAHREHAAVVFVRGGTTFISVHNSLPFGSIASVHGWDRIGACTLARICCASLRTHVCVLQVLC